MESNRVHTEQLFILAQVDRIRLGAFFFFHKIVSLYRLDIFVHVTHMCTHMRAAVCICASGQSISGFFSHFIFFEISYRRNEKTRLSAFWILGRPLFNFFFFLFYLLHGV